MLELNFYVKSLSSSKFLLAQVAQCASVVFTEIMIFLKITCAISLLSCSFSFIENLWTFKILHICILLGKVTKIIDLQNKPSYIEDPTMYIYTQQKFSWIIKTTTFDEKYNFDDDFAIKNRDFFTKIKRIWKNTHINLYIFIIMKVHINNFMDFVIKLNYIINIKRNIMIPIRTSFYPIQVFSGMN